MSIENAETTYCVTANEQLGDAVVRAVADAKDVDPTTLERLYDIIDPDALDALFQPGYTDHADAIGVVRFTYCGYEVVARSDGQVRLQNHDA